MILTEEILYRLPGDVLGGLRRVDSAIADLVVRLNEEKPNLGS
jgi:hypothetical protein